MKFRHGVESPGVMLVAAGPGAVATVRIQFTDVTMVPDQRCGVDDIMRIPSTPNYKYQHAGLVFINGSGQRDYLAYTGYTVNAPGDITFTGCNVLYALAYSHPVGSYAGVVNCSMLRAYDGAAWNPQWAMGAIARIKNFDPNGCLFDTSACANLTAPSGWPLWDGTMPSKSATVPMIPTCPMYFWYKDGWSTAQLKTCTNKVLGSVSLSFDGASTSVNPWFLIVRGYPNTFWTGRKLDNNNDGAGIYTRLSGCSPIPATIELEMVAP